MTMLENFRGQIDWFHLEKTGLSYSKWFARNDRLVREGLCDGVMRERLERRFSCLSWQLLREAYCHRHAHNDSYRPDVV